MNIQGLIRLALLGFLLPLLLMGATEALAQDKKPKPQVFFTNVHIFDGRSETPLKNRRVLVEGNLIKAVGDKTLKACKGATVIDGGGRTLMPGICCETRQCRNRPQQVAIAAHAADKWLWRFQRVLR